MTQNSHLEGNSLPLQGIRVLELGSFIAAPFAARLFGDFGAEVIKIEKPQGGDELRDWRKTRGTTSMLFRTIGRNKKSVALDLRSEAGREAVKKIAAQCDVVIENFRPGTLEKWGLGPDVLQELNPDMVMVRISGYGQTGPYKNRAGFGSSAESFAGLRYITGEPDRPAGRAAASMGDTVAGLYGVIGALMLMLQKARGLQTGTSQVVDVALYEGVFSLLESLVPDYDAYGMVRQRTGGALPGVVPTGSYLCGDGLEVVIGGNSNSVFVRLMRAIGREDLAEDEYAARHGGPRRPRGRTQRRHLRLDRQHAAHRGAGQAGRRRGPRRSGLRRPEHRRGQALPGARHDPDPRGGHRGRARADPVPRRRAEDPRP